MAHLAVSMNGTVLLFREQRDRGSIEVKRSEDGGNTWGEFLVVGKRVDLEADMSDDGRYKGDHVGWSELANELQRIQNAKIMMEGEERIREEIRRRIEAAEANSIL